MNLKSYLTKGVCFALLSFNFFLNSCELKKAEEPAPVETSPPAPQNPSEPEPDECLTKPAADNGQIIPNQYIVKLKNSNSFQTTEARKSFLSRTGIPEHKILHAFHGTFHGFAAKMGIAELEKLRANSEVETVEPDRVVSIVSCYTQVSEQSIPWGIKRVGGSSDGTGKRVWIIDTGVDLDHPDLNVDAANSKSFISGTSPDDDYGHGSHVAGTIAAKDNLKGVIGVAANATIISLKVMDSSGRGSMSNILAAVNHVSANGKAGDVVNMSIGGEGNEMVDNAIYAAASKGILFAVAAGNDHINASTQTPARVNHPNVFTVSAMNSDDVFASFSNFGNECVDYCAPGVNIPSTHKNGGYATMSGTSMATPHVAGLLLLDGKNILKDGFVKADPDSLSDPIAHK